MKPSIGRVVHYVARGSADGKYLPEHRAAIINDIYTDTLVGLTVFNPRGLHWVEVEQDEKTKAGGTWHWPERE